MHSHSMSSVLATMLDPDSSEFKVTHIEMIKVRRSYTMLRAQPSVLHTWHILLWAPLALLPCSGSFCAVPWPRHKPASVDPPAPPAA